MTQTSTLLYAIFALGGVAICLMLPRGGRSYRAAGGVLGAAAIASLFVLMSKRWLGGTENEAFFYLFAAVAIGAAARVITHPRAIYSALYFVLVVLAVGGMLLLQQAEFLAVALVMIYAGAILVTYLFVIMLAQQSGSPVYDQQSREPFAAVVAGFVLMALIAGLFVKPESQIMMASPPSTVTSVVADSAMAEGSNVRAIGAVVMTKYIVATELSAILLLISMVGAIALSRRQVPSELGAKPRRPLGEIGKEVEPF